MSRVVWWRIAAGRIRWLLAAAAAAGPIAAATAAATNWSRAPQVTVVTVDYRFIPHRLTFRLGVAYRLHIVNRGTEQHEFTAPAFFKTVEIGDPAMLNADKTEVEIPPGTAKDLYFLPQRAGHYDLRCSDHDWAGMTGEITVK